MDRIPSGGLVPASTLESNDILEKLIEEGRLLRQRIEEHFRSGPDALPPGEQISIPELEAWYKGVTHILEIQFGIESAEGRLWREGLERINKESWEGVGRVHPYGGHWPIHNLVESLGLLAQIRLLELNQQQSIQITVSIMGLHPKIADRCQSSFMARKYDSAVLEAFKAVEEAVREKAAAPATEFGVALVSYAMNPKNPRLLFSAIPAEQEGYHALFRGAIGALKNPLSHRSIGHSDPVRVFEHLAFASLLMRLIDDLPKSP
jgi:uncharacterized protein (TIGR02391 family)